MQVANQPLTKIQPYAENTKHHPEEQIQRIARSIKKYGFNQPIVVDKNFVIIVGHGRYFAAQELGMEEVPVVVLNLSEQHAKEYRLMDNRANESAWDWDKLVIELAELPEIKMEFPELDFGKDPSTQLAALPTREKGDLETVTFTLHCKQAASVKQAIRQSQNEGEFVEYEGLNENKNGNALARICEFYLANYGE